MTQIDEMPMNVAKACFCSIFHENVVTENIVIYRRDAFVLYRDCFC
jgi:hypothetical protein